MKATEIVEKFKEVLLGAEKEVEVQAEAVEATEEVQEDVQLSEEVTEESTEEVSQEVELEEEVSEETSEDVVEELNETLYATKEEMAEVKAMIEQLKGMVKTEQESLDVPAELSAVEEEVEPIVHTPENATEKKEFINYSSKSPRNTMSRVLEMINKQ